MTRAGSIRRAALATMTLVTLASLWAWAEPPHADGMQTPSGAAADAHAGEGARRAEHGEERPGVHGRGSTPEDENPPPINWTQFGAEAPPFLAMLINFGILLGAYYLLGKKPIADALQNRRDTIAKEIDEAQGIKHEAEERAKKYQSKLEALEADARNAREALVRGGEAEAERIIREAEAKAERMQRDTEFLVQQELKQVQRQLWRDAVDTAVAAAAELLQQRVTPVDHERLAEDYLVELGRLPQAASNADASGPKPPGGGPASESAS